MFFFLLILRFFAHIVNLSCKEMLSEADKYDLIVEKLQHIISYVSFLSFPFFLKYAYIIIDSQFTMA